MCHATTFRQKYKCRPAPRKPLDVLEIAIACPCYKSLLRQHELEMFQASGTHWFPCFELQPTRASAHHVRQPVRPAQPARQPEPKTFPGSQNLYEYMKINNIMRIINIPKSVYIYKISKRSF